MQIAFYLQHCTYYYFFFFFYNSYETKKKRKKFEKLDALEAKIQLKKQVDF